jgi:hypothetical protein
MQHDRAGDMGFASTRRHCANSLVCNSFVIINGLSGRKKFPETASSRQHTQFERLGWFAEVALVNYRGPFQNRLGTQTNGATL